MGQFNRRRSIIQFDYSINSSKINVVNFFEGLLEVRWISVLGFYLQCLSDLFNKLDSSQLEKVQISLMYFVSQIHYYQLLPSWLFSYYVQNSDSLFNTRVEISLTFICNHFPYRPIHLVRYVCQMSMLPNFNCIVSY